MKRIELTTSPREIPKWVIAEASLVHLSRVSLQVNLTRPYTMATLSLYTLADLSKKLMGDKGTWFAEHRIMPSIDSTDFFCSMELLCLSKELWSKQEIGAEFIGKRKYDWKKGQENNGNAGS